MQTSSSIELLWRYLTFVWLFDEVPARAGMLQRAAIVRSNRERGLRFLPVYIWETAAEHQRFGYAASMVWVLYIVTVLVIVAQFVVARRWRNSVSA